MIKAMFSHPDLQLCVVEPRPIINYMLLGVNYLSNNICTDDRFDWIRNCIPCVNATDDARLNYDTFIYCNTTLIF